MRNGNIRARADVLGFFVDDHEAVEGILVKMDIFIEFVKLNNFASMVLVYVNDKLLNSLFTWV